MKRELGTSHEAPYFVEGGLDQGEWLRFRHPGSLVIHTNVINLSLFSCCWSPGSSFRRKPEVAKTPTQVYEAVPDPGFRREDGVGHPVFLS
ncbi:MAG: hypothetical protein U9N60_10485 [Thermodesulfobacteriota bacterium]|nr:hypothetical protein [Thermodesulfobacteriota bacterium]